MAAVNTSLRVVNNGNVKLKIDSENGIVMNTTKKRPSKATLEIRNQSNRWVVYQLKSSKPKLFLLKPCSSGVLAPNDLQPFQIILLPGHSSQASYRILLEATLIPTLSSGWNTINARRIWQIVKKENITQILLPLKIVDSVYSMKQETFSMRFDVAESNERKPMELLSKVVSCLRREDLVAFSVVFLCIYIVFAFMLGYLSQSFKCRCPRK